MNSSDARSATQTERVAFLIALREVVARRCPHNKVGTPLVSAYDIYDMIWSDDAERDEAWAKAKKRRDAQCNNLKNASSKNIS